MDKINEILRDSAKANRFLRDIYAEEIEEYEYYMHDVLEERPEYSTYLDAWVEDGKKFRLTIGIQDADGNAITGFDHVIA